MAFISIFQKIHLVDGQAHSDSDLCEILQAQSVKLIPSDTSSISIEATETKGDICPRCRRFVLSGAGSVCIRCEQVLKEL